MKEIKCLTIPLPSIVGGLFFVLREIFCSKSFLDRSNTTNICQLQTAFLYQKVIYRTSNHSFHSVCQISISLRMSSSSETVSVLHLKVSFPSIISQFYVHHPDTPSPKEFQVAPIFKLLQPELNSLF